VWTNFGSLKIGTSGGLLRAG